MLMSGYAVPDKSPSKNIEEPLIPEKPFPRFIENSYIDIRSEGVEFILEDDQQNIQLTF